MLTGILQYKFFPSRSKILCSEISVKIYRSPLGPPLTPASPSPLKRILVPVSTPDGIFTERDLSFSSCPEPLHFWQGFLIICPIPEHVGHPLSTVKKPC